MNSAHVHLLVNHLPLFAAMFGGVFLAVGLWRRWERIAKAGLILCVVAAVGAVLAVQSGERAEEVVEGIAGVSESTIEQHEEAGEAAQWGAVLLGALAFGALIVPDRRERLKRSASLATLGAALIAFVLVARAANLGGLIRHPEIGDGFTSSQLLEEDENSGRQ